MMKLLKLLLLFAAILGGIVAASLWLRPQPASELPAIPNETLAQNRERFEQEWQQQGDWDRQMFLAQCNMVDQLGTLHDVSELRTFVAQKALQVVRNRVVAEWASPTCREYQVDKYVSAIDTITSNCPAQRSAPEVLEVKRVNAVYRRALAFVNRTVGMSPDYRGRDNWNSFTQYANSLHNTRTALLSNADYKQYLVRITRITDGLQGLDHRIDAARERFRADLARSIMDYYRQAGYTTHNYADLTFAVSAYYRQFRYDSQLEDFSGNFYNRVRRANP